MNFNADGAVKYISVDGDRLATIAYKKPLTLWNMESGQVERAVENAWGTSRIHLAFPHAVACHCKYGTLRIWDLEEGCARRSVQLEDNQVRQS